MTNLKSKIRCPTCDKPNTWTPENPFKPFCCDRCKLIDLGQWASEEHHIAGDPAHPDQPDEDQE